MYPYVTGEHFQGIPKIVDLVDVDSEKWKQLATERSFPMSWIYGREARAVRKLETKIGDSSKLVTLVSESEAQLYRDLITPSAQSLASAMEWTPNISSQAPLQPKVPSTIRSI